MNAMLRANLDRKRIRMDHRSERSGLDKLQQMLWTNATWRVCCQNMCYWGATQNNQTKVQQLTEMCLYDKPSEAECRLVWNMTT